MICVSVTGTHSIFNSCFSSRESQRSSILKCAASGPFHAIPALEGRQVRHAQTGDFRDSGFGNGGIFRRGRKTLAATGGAGCGLAGTAARMLSSAMVPLNATGTTPPANFNESDAAGSLVSAESTVTRTSLLFTDPQHKCRVFLCYPKRQGNLRCHLRGRSSHIFDMNGKRRRLPQLETPRTKQPLASPSAARPPWGRARQRVSRSFRHSPAPRPRTHPASVFEASTVTLVSTACGKLGRLWSKEPHVGSKHNILRILRAVPDCESARCAKGRSAREEYASP